MAFICSLLGHPQQSSGPKHRDWKRKIKMGQQEAKRKEKQNGGRARIFSRNGWEAQNSLLRVGLTCFMGDFTWFKNVTHWLEMRAFWLIKHFCIKKMNHAYIIKHTKMNKLY